MGIFGFFKLFMPLILEYAKEVIFPGADAKKTTPLERVSILVIIILVSILAFLGDSFFVLYGEKQTLKTEVTKKELKIESQKKEIKHLTDDISELESKVCKIPTKTPPYDGQTNRPTKVVRDEDLTLEQRLQMINNINNS